MSDMDRHEGNYKDVSNYKLEGAKEDLEASKLVICYRQNLLGLNA